MPSVFPSAEPLQTAQSQELHHPRSNRPLVRRGTMTVQLVAGIQNRPFGALGTWPGA